MVIKLPRINWDTNDFAHVQTFILLHVGESQPEAQLGGDLVHLALES